VRLRQLPEGDVVKQLVSRRDVTAVMQIRGRSGLIPEPFREEVVAYLTRGTEPGAFVGAVIAGDLFASIENKPASAPKGSIGKIVSFLKRYAPHRAYGRPDKVRVWVKTGGLLAAAGKA
jgi:hypothetical protein